MARRDHRAKAALAEIAADLDNIRVAWNYWAQKQNAYYLLEFVSALWMFFEVRGSYIPAIQFFGDAAKKLAADEVCGPLKAAFANHSSDLVVLSSLFLQEEIVVTVNTKAVDVVNGLG